MIQVSVMSLVCIFCIIFIFYEHIFSRKIVEFVDKHSWLYIIIGIGFTVIIVVDLLHRIVRVL